MPKQSKTSGQAAGNGKSQQPRATFTMVTRARSAGKTAQQKAAPCPRPRGTKKHERPALQGGRKAMKSAETRKCIICVGYGVCCQCGFL
jgi:hypothetical protein